MCLQIIYTFKNMNKHDLELNIYNGWYIMKPNQIKSNPKVVSWILHLTTSDDTAPVQEIWCVWSNA